MTVEVRYAGGFVASFPNPRDAAAFTGDGWTVAPLQRYRAYRSVSGGRVLASTFPDAAEAGAYVDCQVRALIERAVRNDARIQGEALALHEARQRAQWTVEDGGAP